MRQYLCECLNYFDFISVLMYLLYLGIYCDVILRSISAITIHNIMFEASYWQMTLSFGSAF